MKKYIITYHYDGHGRATVEADSPEEAKELFDEGDYIEAEDWTDNVEVNNIKEF